jgi:hypothetical protein
MGVTEEQVSLVYLSHSGYFSESPVACGGKINLKQKCLIADILGGKGIGEATLLAGNMLLDEKVGDGDIDGAFELSVYSTVENVSTVERKIYANIDSLQNFLCETGLLAPNI